MIHRTLSDELLLVDPDVELIEPVDNSSDGGEEAGGTVVVLISPGLAEEDDSPFRGFKPSFATNFGGFLPSNFELGSVLDSSETDVLHSFGIPGVSVSISVTDQEKEQAAQPAEVELTFNLKDILDQGTIFKNSKRRYYGIREKG